MPVIGDYAESEGRPICEASALALRALRIPGGTTTGSCSESIAEAQQCGGDMRQFLGGDGE